MPRIVQVTSPCTYLISQSPGNYSAATSVSETLLSLACVAFLSYDAHCHFLKKLIFPIQRAVYIIMCATETCMFIVVVVVLQAVKCKLSGLPTVAVSTHYVQRTVCNEKVSN